MSAERHGSEEPVPTTENDVAPTAAENSTVTPEQLQAMQAILNTVYQHRSKDGHDTSKVFHRKVNKRAIPSYYDIIKEPIALSTVKAKIATKAYKDFKEFVRDFALITHNAQVYNASTAPAYEDALEIEALLRTQLQGLVDKGLISVDTAKLPYLGDIPAQDEFPAAEEDEEDDDDDDDDEDDEEVGDESDDSRGKRRGRGRPRGSTNIKREPGSKEDLQRRADSGFRKKRARPPKVDTPMEARIKNILKALRRLRNDTGQSRLTHFERLPDKALIPEYFNEIKTPMALDVIKKKFKRKKYQSLEQFISDLELMFENAKSYNEDESDIFKDAVELQKAVREIADEERKKPDSEFVMEDGRLPLPNGILHNGELYRVGDWVHIQNANDLTKPLVVQIYRTWQDAAGTKWVNGCWYYRPEQTVHRFDKHFFENEVVKTGQYRDHQVDEIVDRCFVMFVTRYSKGRPRNFPRDKDIYVCTARYNEEKHTLNNIKTWASCLPDEVRDKDYEMEIYPEPKKMKKHPSPIAYLLKEDAKETDELPKPEWGADNAPPKIGAVHKRPRDPRDSLPPEPTPSPPPREPTPPPPRPAMSKPISNFLNRQNSYANNTMTHQPPLSATQFNSSIATPRSYQSAVSPAPATKVTSDTRGYSTQTPQTNYNPRAVPTTVQTSYSLGANATYAASANYKAPPPTEVWHLSDSANASIPPDIREQFERDEYGRVLFFTAPPLEVLPPVREGAALGHSVRYLAAKANRVQRLKEKRKRWEDAAREREDFMKQEIELEQIFLATKMDKVKQKGLAAWQQQLIQGTQAEFRNLYGAEWREMMSRDLDRLQREQAAVFLKKQQAAESHLRRKRARPSLE